MFGHSAKGNALLPDSWSEILFHKQVVGNAYRLHGESQAFIDNKI